MSDSCESECLPDGWRRIYSKSHKKYYYFNPSNGESVWSVDDIKMSGYLRTFEDELSPSTNLRHSNTLGLGSNCNSLKSIKKENTLKKQHIHLKNVKFEDVSSMVEMKDKFDCFHDRYTEDDNKIGKRDIKVEGHLNSTSIICSQIVDCRKYDLYIVVDTNVLVQHIDFVKSIKNLRIPGYASHCLVIPWAVITELDGLKDGSRVGNNIHARAQKAICYVNEALQADNYNVLGQTGMESDLSNKYFNVSNNDDLILACCLQKLEKGGVILLTQDVNLRNKATIFGVKAYSSSGLQKLAEIADMKVIVPEDSKGDTSICEIYKNINSTATAILTKIVEIEMKIAFENVWRNVVKLKPPWTLDALLEIIHKHHWVAVFGLVFTRSLKSKLAELHRQYCRLDSDPLKGQILKFSDSLLEVLTSMSTRSKYENELPRAIEKIKEYRKSIDISYQSKTSLIASPVSSPNIGVTPRLGSKSSFPHSTATSPASGVKPPSSTVTSSALKVIPSNPKATSPSSRANHTHSTSPSSRTNTRGTPKAPPYNLKVAPSHSKVLKKNKDIKVNSALVNNLYALMLELKKSRTEFAKPSPSPKGVCRSPERGNSAPENDSSTARVEPAAQQSDTQQSSSTFAPHSPDRSPPSEDQDMNFVEPTTSSYPTNFGLEEQAQDPVKKRLDWIWGKIGKYCSYCFQRLSGGDDVFGSGQPSIESCVKFLRLLYVELFTFAAALTDVLSLVNLSNESAKVDKLLHVLATFCTHLEIPDDDELPSDVNRQQIASFCSKEDNR